MYMHICPACNGSGEGMHEGTRCYACGGTGVEEAEEDVEDLEYELSRQEYLDGQD